MRRAIAGLLAAVAGGVGSFALASGAMAAASNEPPRVATLAVAPMATPTAPDMPCSVSYQTSHASNPQQYLLKASIKNWAPVTSIWWVVYIYLPDGTVFGAHLGVQPMPEYGPGWFSATDSDKAIPPGASQTFRVLYTPPPDTYGVPNRIACAIS